ncbi:hypothetical protein PsAD2_02970 [Pseudovibrio axinellae]|uniref:Uncharacterized protein n=1 Tax=Pseudovibrio axinellae TaxID=989403 RepID=A0A165XEK1_9HYPH|nr:hypothetical protein [Pseudovibrio axinellae]KZL17634.1 hypothetical protein PsAD2_02970 [Pseudovibrio axinellae]SER45538.1 hypothetical protein SAMN05421798_110112 [Pseudovibrio axinellae]
MDNTAHFERAKILASDLTTFLHERGRFNPHTPEVTVTALAYVLRDRLEEQPDAIKRELLQGISDLVRNPDSQVQVVQVPFNGTIS